MSAARPSEISVTIEELDLAAFPNKDATPKELKRQVTFNNLHGNALTLIAALVREKILTLPKDEYLEIVKIYETAQTHLLAPAKIKRFDEILTDAALRPVTTLRIIQGECAGGGVNDYLTLLVFKKLKEMNVECLVSPNSLEFITAFERFIEAESKFSLFAKRYEEHFLPCALTGGEYVNLDKIHLHANSMLRLRQWLNENVIKSKDLIALYQDYKKTLRLFSYSFSADEKSMTFYSPAACDFSIIPKMGRALKLGDNFNISDCKEIAGAIDLFNNVFALDVSKNSVSELFERSALKSAYETSFLIDADAHPLVYLTSNQVTNQLERPSKIKETDIFYVYANGREETSHDHIYVLNNVIGAHPSWNKSEYVVFHSTQHTTASVPAVWSKKTVKKKPFQSKSTPRPLLDFNSLLPSPAAASSDKGAGEDKESKQFPVSPKLFSAPKEVKTPEYFSSITSTIPWNTISFTRKIAQELKLHCPTVSVTSNQIKFLDHFMRYIYEMGCENDVYAIFKRDGIPSDAKECCDLLDIFQLARIDFINKKPTAYKKLKEMLQNKEGLMSILETNRPNVYTVQLLE